MFAAASLLASSAASGATFGKDMTESETEWWSAEEDDDVEAEEAAEDEFVDDDMMTKDEGRRGMPLLVCRNEHRHQRGRGR